MHDLKPYAAESHKLAKNQLALYISADRNDEIIEALYRIINDINKYGKPVQGCLLHPGCTEEVITPKWDGKAY